MMPNRDAVAFTVLDLVLLRQRPFHAPAKEQPLIVAGHVISTDNGPLRPGPGMKPQASMVMAVAVLHQDVMTDLPTNAVAVVVARGHFPHRDSVAVLQPDATRVIPIQISVVRFVAVDRDVLKGDVVYVFAAEKREQCFHLGLRHQPNVFRKARSSLKRLPLRATRVRLITSVPPFDISFARRQMPSPNSKPGRHRQM